MTTPYFLMDILIYIENRKIGGNINNETVE